MNNYKLASQNVVDELAQFIRQVDGKHKMGAGALAEQICERFLVADPNVQEEPVGWQYYQFGKWWPGDTLTREQQNDIKEAGHPIRSVYATPQPVEQQPTTCVGCGGAPAPENSPCAVCGQKTTPVVYVAEVDTELVKVCEDAILLLAARLLNTKVDENHCECDIQRKRKRVHTILEAYRKGGGDE